MLVNFWSHHHQDSFIAKWMVEYKLVLLKGTEIFLLFLKGLSEISLTKLNYAWMHHDNIYDIHERKFMLLPSL